MPQDWVICYRYALSSTISVKEKRYRHKRAAINLKMPPNHGVPKVGHVKTHT